MLFIVNGKNLDHLRSAEDRAFIAGSDSGGDAAGAQHTKELGIITNTGRGKYVDGGIQNKETENARSIMRTKNGNLRLMSYMPGAIATMTESKVCLAGHNAYTADNSERRLPPSGTRGRENNQSFGMMETA